MSNIISCKLRPQRLIDERVERTMQLSTKANWRCWRIAFFSSWFRIKVSKRMWFWNFRDKNMWHSIVYFFLSKIGVWILPHCRWDVLLFLLQNCNIFVWINNAALYFALIWECYPCPTFRTAQEFQVKFQVESTQICSLRHPTNRTTNMH